MLYELHEFTHDLLSPYRAFAQTMREMSSHPMLPSSYSGLGRSLAASAEVFERITRRYNKPDFGLAEKEIGGKTFPVEEQVIARHPFCDLLHFSVAKRPKNHPRVLIVAPLSGHYATLLRGTVEAMLHDHDVYITDWKNARDVPYIEGDFDFDDYVSLLIRFFHTLSINGPFHVMGVCQPSVPVLAAVSLMATNREADRPKTMTLMGGPIDTRISPTEVNAFAESRELEWFERNVLYNVPLSYEGRGRRVYPGFLQLSGFMSMNMDRHVSAHWEFFRHLVRGDGDSAEQHRDFYDEYLSVCDLSARFYLQTIQKVFKGHDLPRGVLEVHGRHADPAAIKDVALLTVEGENDDITGTGQTEAAHTACKGLPKSMRKHYLQPKVGHYGVFNGRRWREEIMPVVRDFIRKHG